MTAKTTTSPTSSRPSRQLSARVSGSSTSPAMKVTRWSRKKVSHRPNRLSVPTSITFIRRPDWMSPWKDSGMASTCSK
jgi:hypothetical protein